MLNSKSFLAIDFGAGSLKLAEFEQNEAGGLCLKQYGIKPLGIEGSQESSREATILKALQEVLAEKSFGTKEINVCAPGFHVFSKFVKLPPVDTAKVTQIIRYEAQQNVPFPLEEVVWDYQILGTSANNELEVLLVAVKTEIVEGLFRVADGAGLRLQLVDVSPAALCNAFRYNYGDLEGCTMLLDIGAKTSNVLFFEKGKVYSRSISIGANSITQDFSNEARLRFAQAEAIKIEKGFVSLGGAYEEPEDPQAAAISKIARQIMTRLHLQVNQTIQFYRSQQGGSAPQRMFLSGGASIMPYTAQFFAEKINVPVDYFNPFRNIEIAPALDLEDLSKYAHSFGEVVGLGLRNLAHCPVEMNLMPQSSIQRQELAQKKPYFIAAIFSLVLVLVAIGWAESRIAETRKTWTATIKEKLLPLTRDDQKLTRILKDTDLLKSEAHDLADLLAGRSYWNVVLSDLRQVLIRAEDKTRASLLPKYTNADVGVWVASFSPVMPTGSSYSVQSDTSESGPEEDLIFAMRPRMGMPGAPPAAAPPAGAPPAKPGRSASKTPVLEITAVNLTCRAVNRDKLAGANSDLAYAVKEELKNSACFTEPITFVGDTRIDDTNTFSFTIKAQLKRPAKF